MSPVHISDAQTQKQSEDALRDILFLYRELVAYGGMPGDHDIGSFEPLEFIAATRHGWSTDEDLRLLHEGSAVALLCDLMDEMEQRGGDTGRFRNALEAGLLDHLPVAKEALRAGLTGPEELHQASVPVYRHYVLGYLRALVE